MADFSVQQADAMGKDMEIMALAKRVHADFGVLATVILVIEGVDDASCGCVIPDTFQQREDLARALEVLADRIRTGRTFTDANRVYPN